MKLITLSAIQLTRSGALSTAVCLMLGAATIHAQERTPEGDQRESGLQQIRQRMMDRRHEDFPEQDGSARGLAPNRRGSPVRAAEEQDGPGTPGAFRARRGDAGFPPPPMASGRPEGDGSGPYSGPGAFRAQRGDAGVPPQPMAGGRPEPDGSGPYSGPGAFRAQRGDAGFPPPPMAGGRPEGDGSGPYSGNMQGGPGYSSRFQDGPAAAPGGPGPLMRDGGRSDGFGYPGMQGAFRPRRSDAGFPPQPMAGGRPEGDGFGPYSGDMDRGPRYSSRFQDGPGAPGGPPPFMRDGGRRDGFGYPGMPGAFRPRRGDASFPPPPMAGGRPEWDGFGPYSGDMQRSPRYSSRFQDGPGAPGGPARFMRDGGRRHRFGYPGMPGAFRPRRGDAGFPPPPMAGGRPEWDGSGPYSGDDE